MPWRERVVLVALVMAAVARRLLLARQRAPDRNLGQRVTARIRKRWWVHVQTLPVAHGARRGAGRLLVDGQDVAGVDPKPPANDWRYGWPVRLMNVATPSTYFVAGVAKVAGPLG